MAGKASTTWLDGKKPSIGDLTTACKIGKSGRAIYIWAACHDCEVERWVKRCTEFRYCMSCAAIRRDLKGENNPRWNGGVRQDKAGYKYITVSETNPYFEMAGKSLHRGKFRYCVAEHRLVMAQHIGRSLKPWELVHHLNGNKWDNRIENLELLRYKKEHLPSISVQRLEKELIECKERITLLEAEVTRLESLLIYKNAEI